MNKLSLVLDLRCHRLAHVELQPSVSSCNHCPDIVSSCALTSTKHETYAEVMSEDLNGNVGIDKLDNGNPVPIIFPSSRPRNAG